MNQTVHDLVKATAGKAARKWKEDRDDIAQDLYLWVFSKLDYSFFDDYEASAKDEDDESEYDEKLRRFKSSLYWEAERYCRKEKAEREGYSVRDEAFYGIAQLQELLVNYYQEGITATPPTGRADSVRRSGDAAEGGNYLASMLDVDAGLSRLEEKYLSRLKLRFGPLVGLSDESIAGLSQSEVKDLTGMHHETFHKIIGQTKDQVRHRTNTALKALQAKLGGSNPHRYVQYADVA